MGFGPFPATRPAGLRRRTLPAGTELWRIDAQSPRQWSWEGFERPRHRFDPASGSYRVRYAASTVPGAARERYFDSGLYMPADHASHRLVHLVAQRALRVLDLRTEANLDALGVDDRVSTGHEPDVWEACHDLADAVRRWLFDLDGIAYRSRTTPESSYNVAFFSTAGLQATSRPLSQCGRDLDDLVLRHGFTIAFPW